VNLFRRWSDIYKARLDEKVRDLLQKLETTAVAEGSADAAARGAKKKMTCSSSMLSHFFI